MMNTTKERIFWILVIFNTLVLMGTLYPLYQFAGDINNFINSFNTIFSLEKPAYSIMILSYLVATLLLLMGRKNPWFVCSIILFCAGYATAWWGFFTNGFNPAIYIADENGRTTTQISGIFLILSVLLPLLSLICYVTLSWSEDSQRKYEADLKRKSIERAKIGFIKEFTAFVLGLGLAGLYTIGMIWFYQWWICYGITACQSWGSLGQYGAVIGILGFLISMVLVIAWGKGSLAEETRSARYLIIPILIIFLIGNYWVLNSSVVSNDQRLIISQAWGKDEEISWDLVESYSLSYLDEEDCNDVKPYLLLQNGDRKELPFPSLKDHRFIEYLQKRQINRMIDESSKHPCAPIAQP
jgi:hypothetical protein